MAKQNLSQNTWFTVAIMILFFPVGFILMWINRKIPATIKAIFSTIVVIFFLILSIGSCEISKTNDVQESSSVTVVDTSESTTVTSPTTINITDDSKDMPVQEILDIASNVPLLSDGWTVDKSSEVYQSYIYKTITVTGRVSIADIAASEIELTTSGDDGVSVSVYGLSQSKISSYATQYPFGNKIQIKVKGFVTAFDDMGVTLENCTLVE